MKAGINILSISDVITNSSSEVFIIHGKPEYQNELNTEIPGLLDQICELLDYNPKELFEVYVANEEYEDSDYGYKYFKDDLIIESVGDNSIPDFLMNLIESIDYIKKFKKYFPNGLYAEDLGTIKMNVYNWRSHNYEEVEKKIRSIQRVHLG